MTSKVATLFRTIGLVLSLSFCSGNLAAQGCSDAGICSAGGMLPGAMKTERGSVTLNMQFGQGEQNVQIMTPQAEIVSRLNRKNAIQLKLPYVFADGNLGTNMGWGDIIAVLSHNFYDTNQHKLNLNIGARIGVSAANRTGSTSVLSNAISLPMPYQTSLGTHDLLVGLDYKYKEKWLFALGAQVPLYQFNTNDFDTSKLQPDETDARQYFSSDHLYRSPDIILRADRVLKVNEKLFFTGGILAIYHLSDDKAINSMGTEVAIRGSKGLTLNIPLAAGFQFNDNFSCTVRYASPVIVRKVRPDGLTRHFVIGLEVKYSF